MSVGLIHNTTIDNTKYVLSRCLKTCEEMLRDRGCTQVETHPNVNDAMESGETVMKGRGRTSIDIYFHNEDRVGVKIVRNLIETNSVDLIVLVSTEGPTTFTRKEAEDMNNQFFTFKEQFVNLTRHCILPKHESR